MVKGTEHIEEMGDGLFEDNPFDYLDFEDSLEALLLQTPQEGFDLNEALKEFVSALEVDDAAGSPGEGSSVNNDTLSPVGRQTGKETSCGINEEFMLMEEQELRDRGTMATEGSTRVDPAFHVDRRNSCSSSSHFPAIEPVQQVLPLASIRITSGIPGNGETSPWGPVRQVETGFDPPRNIYQPQNIEGHPYPHPFSTPTRLASQQVPVVSVIQQVDEKANGTHQEGSLTGKGGKRKTPTVDWTKIEDVEERRRQRRLEKNRNTAAVSRERKKAQLQRLEERVKQLEQDNAALKYWLAYREQELHILSMNLITSDRGAGDIVSKPEPEAGAEPAVLILESSIAIMLLELLLLVWSLAKPFVPFADLPIPETDLLIPAACSLQMGSLHPRIEVVFSFCDGISIWNGTALSKYSIWEDLCNYATWVVTWIDSRIGWSKTFSGGRVCRERLE